MKTAREWFKENLTDEQNRRAWKLMNYQGKLDRLNDERLSFKEALMESFCWSDNPEKRNIMEEGVYWDNISEGITPGGMPWKKKEEGMLVVDEEYYRGRYEAELEIAKKLLEDNGYLVKKKVVITREQIAEKFGLDVSEIEIEK